MRLLTSRALFLTRATREAQLGHTLLIAQPEPVSTRAIVETNDDGIESELTDYDYRVALWEQRALEAGFISSKVKIKNRALGEYRDTCFLLGYIDDKEFEVEREPIDVPCDKVAAIERYKAGNQFSSNWIAN